MSVPLRWPLRSYVAGTIYHMARVPVGEWQSALSRMRSHRACPPIATRGEVFIIASCLDADTCAGWQKLVWSHAGEE